MVCPASTPVPNSSNSNIVLISPSAVGIEALHAEPALADAGEEVAVLAELVLVGRQLGRPHDVEPVRVVLPDLVAHVEHREAVDVHGAASARPWPSRPGPWPALRVGLGAGSAPVGVPARHVRARARRAPASRQRARQQPADAMATDGTVARIRHRRLAVLARVDLIAARSLPSPTRAPAPRLVEEPLVVALADLLARLRRQLSRTAARTCRRPSGTSPGSVGATSSVPNRKRSG